MAVLRNDPYRNFNFRVDLGGGDADSVAAGFFEVVLPSAEVSVAEYRAGNSPVGSPQKITGLTKYSEVVLRRGLIGSTDLWEWFKQTRDGSPEERSVRVDLLDEDRTEVVMSWRLTGARPVKYTAPTLNAKGTDVAVEELVLAIEGLEVE